MALESAVPGGNERIQKEIDVEVGEIQSVFVEVGEALGVVPHDDHSLIVATKSECQNKSLDLVLAFTSPPNRRLSLETSPFRALRESAIRSVTRTDCRATLDP